jgi:hypothetical protein
MDLKVKCGGWSMEMDRTVTFEAARPAPGRPMALGKTY